jgi:hypothetical protein
MLQAPQYATHSDRRQARHLPCTHLYTPTEQVRAIHCVCGVDSCDALHTVELLPCVCSAADPATTSTTVHTHNHSRHARPHPPNPTPCARHFSATNCDCGVGCWVHYIQLDLLAGVKNQHANEAVCWLQSTNIPRPQPGSPTQLPAPKTTPPTTTVEQFNAPHCGCGVGSCCAI